ncbi:Hypothetical protein R9X50_00429700 [Acrodontium crateriforme]|uniref:Uncharacterized protein n=1 Tax=Acrodontium crateriforme TaxID=150365 RepID=A0AAQ3M7R7_9PEZI|nr:Hypothetical protein R9X50_00429700 [Acrodontium crateriforme]
MADGLNHARAMRITEIMMDFRNILNYISTIRASPSAEDYNEDGYVVLRHCVNEAQALLTQPFQTQNGSQRDTEQEKTQLKHIISDAAVRRFKAQKIYLRATAALRWVNSRSAILKGQRPHAGHAAALQQIQSALRMELASITDARTELSLRSADSRAGKWLQEDPSLGAIQRATGSPPRR